jgi:hypothetical protein
MARIRNLSFSDGVSVTAPSDLALGGGGSGEVNLVENANGDSALDGGNTNDVGDWIDSGTGTTSSITSTAADIPLYPLKDNAIKILNDGSSTGYTRYRFTLPPALITRKLKISWEQFVSTSTAYVAGDFKVEMYSNASSNYSGAYTAIALSTDVSSVSSIPAANGKYQTTFDTSTATYLELRITRTAGTANSYICLNEVVVGPGIQPQGAVIGTTETVTFTGTFTNTTYTAKRTRIGEWAEYQVLMSLTGTPGAATLTLTLPSGDVIDTTSLVDSNSQFLPGAQVQLIDTGTAGYVGCLRAETSTTVGIYYIDDAAAAVTRTAVTQAAPYTFANTDKIDITFRVPLARYAGSGIVNVVNNDVEYASNSSSTDAADTTSFAYGPSGSAGIFGTTALTAPRQKTVRFQNPIQQTDELSLEIYDTTMAAWLPISASRYGSLVYSVQNTTKYGMTIIPVSNTDVNVYFAQYSLPTGATFAAAGESWAVSPASGAKWRVKKSSGGQAVGFGKAAKASLGLTTSYVPTITSSTYAASASYTVLDGDGYDTILVTTGNTDRTITLPTAVDNSGRKLTIKKVDSGTGTVTVDGEGSETIDGATTKVLSAQYTSLAIQCDGSAWHATSTRAADTASFSVSVTGPITTSVTFRASRVGDVVTVLWSGALAAGVSSATAITLDFTNFPSWARPAVTTSTPTFTRDNGTYQTVMGQLVIPTSGNGTVNKTYASGAFTSNTGTTGFDSGSVSYTGGSW